MEKIAELLTPYVFVGNEGMLIDGIKCVHKWEEDCIQLIAVGKIITVEGRRLKLEHKSLDSILISGRITTIIFGKRSFL